MHACTSSTGRLREEAGQELKGSLGHTMKLCFKNTQTNPQKPVSKAKHGKSNQNKPKQSLLDMQSLLEVIQSRTTLISLWILIGSVLGGLLLLALLVFCLWKVSPAFVGAHNPKHLILSRTGSVLGH